MIPRWPARFLSRIRTWLRRDLPWEMCLMLREQTLMDGSRANGLLMARRVNGEWQYRRPTEAEENEDFHTRQW